MGRYFCLSILDNLPFQVVCPDCELAVVEGEETICAKCLLRRSERKEIITEIVETEGKYGRDLRIIVEEFYRPMLVAGLLSSDQLASIFLNVEQLIQVSSLNVLILNNQRFNCFVAGELIFLPAVERSSGSGHSDRGRRVDWSQRWGALHPGHAHAPGKLRLIMLILMLMLMLMLQAFETYCTKQAASSMLLATMEREKELLRVFLKVITFSILVRWWEMMLARVPDIFQGSENLLQCFLKGVDLYNCVQVSQMENKILRRMNLSSFLMVPVQRITKYPLLLARLLKVLPHLYQNLLIIVLAQKYSSQQNLTFFHTPKLNPPPCPTTSLPF